MSNDNPIPTRQTCPSTTGNDPVPEYEIRFAGRLSPRRSGWFDGLTVDTDANGTTVIRGPVVDRAELNGLIQKLRDVGIPLISLTQIPSHPTPEPPAHPTQGELP